MLLAYVSFIVWSAILMLLGALGPALIMAALAGGLVLRLELIRRYPRLLGVDS